MGVDRDAVDGADGVASGQGGRRLPGAPRQPFAEIVGELEGERPGDPDHRCPAIGVGAERDLADSFFARTTNGEADSLREIAEGHLLLELLEHRHRRSADGDDLVARPQPGPPGGAAGAHRRGPGGDLADTEAEGE